MRPNTRGAIYFGDRLSDACTVLSVNGTMLRDAEVISTGTFTKLRRRYRGLPVEEATRNKIIEFLKDRTDDRARVRFAAIKLDLENDVLVPAWCQLTDQARIAANNVRPFVRTKVMRADHIDHAHIAALLRGGYAVRKHVFPIAQHIFENCQAAEIQLPGCNSSDDLINDEAFDHNICCPSIYPRENRLRLPQLGLTDGRQMLSA